MNRLSLSLAACFLLFWACPSLPAPPPASPGLPPADLGPVGLQQGLPAQSGPVRPSEKPKPEPQAWFARYRLVTVPDGVGVFRETGDMIGLTPMTLELTSGRALKLTFLKKGYIITSQFLLPEAGNHELTIILKPASD